MARYYTLCEATPGKSLGKNRYLRVYAHPAEAFLFHDTEDSLMFPDIQKALWMLSALYEGAKRVIAIRVDDNTIMATFSTVALPKPVRPGTTHYSTTKTEEYLEASRLTGWLLRDIKDPASEPIHVDYNDLYNDCIMLERVTDCCPCVKQSEGTCLPNTVYLRHPWLAEYPTHYSGTDLSSFRVKRFENVNGFEYVSGQFAIQEDFTEAVRPWDNYDFSLVEKRKATFADRGQDLAHRAAHRKVECSQCTFSVKKYTGEYTDCGHLSACNAHTTEEQAWAVLFDWLQNDTYFITGTDGFTPAEINYLIKEAGRTENSNSICATRKVPTHLGGFHTPYTRDPLRYLVTAARGHLNRHKYYDSYEDLRVDYPMLPASADIPNIEIAPKMMLAHAIYAGWPYVAGRSGGWGHNNHPIWRVELQHGTMSVYGYTSSGFFHGPSLSIASSVDEYVRAKWGWRQSDISAKYLTLAAR